MLRMKATKSAGVYYYVGKVSWLPRYCLGSSVMYLGSDNVLCIALVMLW